MNVFNNAKLVNTTFAEVNNQARRNEKNFVGAGRLLKYVGQLG